MVNNKSYLYVLPMFGTKWSHYHSVEQTYLFNNLGDNTFIVECNEDIIELDNNPYLIKKFSYQERLFYCMLIPVQYKEDYMLITDSSYSVLSEKYKQKIIHFHSLGKKSKFRKILYRDESLYQQLEESLDVTISRLAEIGSAIDIKQETIIFDKDDIIEKDKFTKIEW